MKECDHWKTRTELLKSEQSTKEKPEGITQADLDKLKQLNEGMKKTGKQLGKIADEFVKLSPDKRMSMGEMSFMEEQVVVVNEILAQQLSEKVQLNVRLRQILQHLSETDGSNQEE